MTAFPIPPDVRVWAEVDPVAIRDNAMVARRRGGVPLIAVVKANAYGHGVEVAVGALREVAESFAVANIEEAAVVRTLAPEKDVLLLSPCLPGERAAAAALYAALVEAECLALTGSQGPILVEGPFARNRVFVSALAELTGRSVTGRADATGTTGGAALLASGPEGFVKRDLAGIRAAPLDIDIAGYAARWRQRVEE